MSGVSLFRFERALGRFVTTAAAVLTLGRMPPFVSSSAIVLAEDRILAILDPVRNEPALPGGHLRWRETPRSAAERETLEETGMIVETGRLIDVVSAEELTGEPGIVRVIYEGAIQGGALTSSAEGEALWMPLDAFLDQSTRDGAILRAWLSLCTLETTTAGE